VEDEERKVMCKKVYTFLLTEMKKRALPTPVKEMIDEVTSIIGIIYENHVATCYSDKEIDSMIEKQRQSIKNGEKYDKNNI
jgi:hypothetical protein